MKIGSSVYFVEQVVPGDSSLVNISDTISNSSGVTRALSNLMNTLVSITTSSDDNLENNTTFVKVDSNKYSTGIHQLVLNDLVVRGSRNENTTLVQGAGMDIPVLAVVINLQQAIMFLINLFMVKLTYT